MKSLFFVGLFVIAILYGLSAGKGIGDNAADKMQRTELVE